MHAFSVGQFNTEEEKRDRDEFFRLTRIDHLRRLRERNSDETGTSSGTTVPPRRGPPSVTTVVPLAGSNTFRRDVGGGDEEQEPVIATEDVYGESQNRVMDAGSTPANHMPSSLSD